MKIQTGIEQQIEKQTGLIVASLFNLSRYSKMSIKKIKEEVLGQGYNTKLKDEEMKTYVMSKEVKDIMSYQANIKLLNKLSKQYGEKDNTASLIGDIQRDFGITSSTDNKS